MHYVAAHGGGPALMAKATGVVASQLQKDADLNGGDFNSRPYYRMFLGLICSLPTSDPTDGNVFGMLTALSNTLALVQVGILKLSRPNSLAFVSACCCLELSLSFCAMLLSAAGTSCVAFCSAARHM